MSTIFGTAENTFALNSGWQIEWNNCDKPIEATVPGTVQNDMFNHGLLPDPFIGSNSALWKNACECDYTYSLSFDVSSEMLDNECIDLVFEGIDTISKITLNGKNIGSTDNMYRTWRFNIKDIIKPENNELKVEINNPRQAGLELREKYYNSSNLLQHSQKDFFDNNPAFRHFIRKMPCSFGWDWGPELPLSGIWKPVLIEGWNNSRIESIVVETKVTPDNKKATVSGHIKFTNRVEENAEIDVYLSLPDDRKLNISKTLLPESENVSFNFDIDNPPLWWPNGLGEQPICTLSAELKKDNNSISSISRKIGIRQLEMVVEP
ncbi:MAG: hypothetical protein KAS17_05780, partial [Victivallaceae bacterium]|nr:hypothetical protein [Victivallaceae bacterium]